MQLGEHLGDRNNPYARLICPECGDEVFTAGTMTFEEHRVILEFAKPDHEHEIPFERRIVSEY